MTLAIDMELKGGKHPNRRMNAVEDTLVKMAIDRFSIDTRYLKKGLKWTYNWIHFLTFWNTKDQALLDLLFDLRPYPQYIEVETTTRCNLKCTMCEHTYWDEPTRDMTLDEFKSIIDQFPELKWIGMTGIGESFLLKDFMRMIEYVKTKTGAYIEMYDSFSFMTKEQIETIVNLGVDRIYASIDAASKETYEKIRIGANYDKVWSNVKYLDEYKKKKHIQYPELAFHYIITTDNIHEVLNFLELLDSLKIDIAFVQYARMLHKYPEAERLYTEVPETTQTEILKKSKELNITVQWNLDLPKDKPPLNQCNAWWMPFIFVNGDVICCCATNEGNKREFQKETRLGNIFKQSFREIWEGEEYKKLIDGIRDSKTPIQCTRCPIFKVS